MQALTCGRACRVDVTSRRFLGAHHASMVTRVTSVRDFQLGLALVRATWQHAMGRAEELWGPTDSSKL